MLKILLNKQAVLMRLFESLDIADALPYFLFNLIAIQFHHSFRRLQKRPVIIQFIQQQSQLRDDVVYPIHLHYQL